MERIFENLKESVSEACFKDIINMVEELLDESLGGVVQRAYDKGRVSSEYWDNIWNRQEVLDISNKEEKEAAEREGVTPYELYVKRNLNSNNYKTRNSQSKNEAKKESKEDDE